MIKIITIAVIILILTIFFTTRTSSGTKGVSLTLYKAGWCPACKGFQPTWDELKQKLSNEPNISLHVIECSEDPNSCADIKYLPSLVLNVNSKRIMYPTDKPKKLDLILDFIKQHGYP